MAVETASLQLTASVPALSEAVGKVIRAVPARASLPALSGILVEVDGQGVTLTATNLESVISCRVAAEVQQPGVTLVPAKVLQGALAGLNGSPLSLAMDGPSLKLRCGPAKATIRCLDPQDFPPVPTTGLGDGERTTSITSSETS